MHPRQFVINPVHEHQWNPDAERRTVTEPGARDINRPSMHLGQLPGDRQSQPEAAKLASAPCFGLPESLEYVRDEFGRNTDTRVADRQLHVRVGALEPDLYSSSALGELDAVRE